MKLTVVSTRLVLFESRGYFTRFAVVRKFTRENFARAFFARVRRRRGAYLRVRECLAASNSVV